MKNNFRNLQKTFTIFQSALFKLTMFYFLIIFSVSLVFNIVIFGSLNLNKMEVAPTIITKNINDDWRNLLIDARNQRAEEQIFHAIMILNFAILVGGGWGSYLLARKSLEPLERVHNLQSQFVSDASHEIRTPLATMQLETELILKDNDATKSDYKEILESNLEEVKSLTAMTEMLLRLSRMGGLKMQKINLNEVIRARIAKIPDTQVVLKETKTFLAEGNEVAVDELLSILIENALKYNLSKKPVEVSIFRSNRQAVFEVSNISEEIPQDKLIKIFDRFYRIDSARSRNACCEGHGLGLAIAKKIAENLGATLNVRNEKVSGTSEFKTTFRVGLKF